MDNNPNFTKPKGYKNCSSTECISKNELTLTSQEEIKKLVTTAVLKENDC